MLAALQKRAARLPLDREQLGVLVEPGVLSGALERPWQQRVRERLAREPLGIERVRLAALARAVLAASTAG